MKSSHHPRLTSPAQTRRRLLSEVKIHDQTSLHRAIEVLHGRYGVPHVVITSLPVPLTAQNADAEPEPEQSRPPPTRTMCVVGSSATRVGRRPRPFRIAFPVFDCYFSGTGDMFAALMVTRMREAVHGVGDQRTAKNNTDNDNSKNSGDDGDGGADTNLETTPSWLSPDDVPATDLPLARAAERVLASMHEVLERTCVGMDAEMRRARVAAAGGEAGENEGEGEKDPKTQHLLRSRAAELRLARNLHCLRSPTVVYRAEAL